MQQGTPLYQDFHGCPPKTGFVVEIGDAPSGQYMIGANGLEPVAHRLVIVWDDMSISEVSEGIAAPWADTAKRYGIEPTTDDLSAMLAKAREHQRQEHARIDAEKALAADAQRAFVEQIRPMIPADAKAAIVAELREDQSDSMTDYYGSRTTRTIVLAWSTHARDLFPEMRKAARNHPETAHLADADKSAEHREKYSMGGGYYLKDGRRHGDGWRVSKTRFYDRDPASSVPFGEIADAIRGKPAKTVEPVTAGAAYTIEQHTHTKKGFEMWIAVPASRVERDVWESERDRAKALGGWWTRKWGKTPGGFAFKIADNAATFVSGTTAPTTPGPDTSKADKLRDLAASCQAKIDAGRGDRLENTPKRQRQAATARMDADRWERAQKGLIALADLHDAGNVPAILANVSTKKAAYDLAHTVIDHSRAGYYDAGRDTHEPRAGDDKAAAFHALLSAPSAEKLRADAIKAAEIEVSRCTIPGYFATPADLARRVIDLADIEAGHTVLEPSAGSGALCEALPEGVDLTTCEHNPRLAELLAMKGFATTAGDFMTLPFGRTFDRVVMNPPFERGQDVEHVKRAFDMLKPGGRLVAITGPGWQFRNDAKYRDFRGWLDSLDYHADDIPAGAFKASGTGVASVLLTISKP